MSTRWIAAVVVLAACEQANPPTPQPIVPVPPDAAPPDAGSPDAPPASVDLQCFANGPKEYIRIKTDPTTMTGTLERMTAGPVPDRKIKYRVVVDGPASVELVFEGYGPGDYRRTGNRKPPFPREHLTVGKSVIARVALVGNRSRISGREVDLHTGMAPQAPDHSYECSFDLH